MELDGLNPEPCKYIPVPPRVVPKRKKKKRQREFKGKIKNEKK